MPGLTHGFNQRAHMVGVALRCMIGIFSLAVQRILRHAGTSRALFAVE